MNVASDGRALRHALATAKFLSNIDLYFDICNGAGRKDKPKVSRSVVDESSVHHVLWQDMIKDLKTWKFIHKFGKSKGKSYVPPCVTGLIDNARCFQRLWSQREKYGFTEMDLRNLNSDPIENLFCTLRQGNGSNRNPTCQQFASSFKTSVLFGNAQKGKGVHSNCLDDDAVLLKLFKDKDEDITLPVPSTLFVPEERVILSRGAVDHVQFLKVMSPSNKCMRQGPVIDANRIASKLAKGCKSNCRLCKNSLLLHDSECFNSDQLLSSNLSSDNRLFTENMEIAGNAKTLNPSGVYASPEFVNLYLKCYSKFLTVCCDTMVSPSCLSAFKSILSECDSFDWLCPDHGTVLKPLILKSIAESLTRYVCKRVNQHLKESHKKKILSQKLRNYRAKVTSNFENTEGDDSEWIDIDGDLLEEEALLLGNLLDDKGK